MSMVQPCQTLSKRWLHYMHECTINNAHACIQVYTRCYNCYSIEDDAQTVHDCVPPPLNLWRLAVQRNILNNSRVSQLQSSDHTHAVTVVVEEGGDYHVTVFPMYEDTGIVGNSVAYSVSISVTREIAIGESAIDTPSTNKTLLSHTVGVDHDRL